MGPAALDPPCNYRWDRAALGPPGDESYNASENAMEMMKALVKKKAQPGLWLDEVPVPEIGINDVLIEVLRTGICGTDVHIYNWDEWSQKTVPVPLVIGHEFVGRIVAIGSNVKDFQEGDIVSGRRPCRLRPMPKLHGRAAAPLHGHQGASASIGPGAFAEYLSPADDQTSGITPKASPRDVQSIFDPLGNAVHTALSFPVLGEDVLITGAGPIGIHGGRRGASRRRPLRRHHRRQPAPARAGQEDEAHRRRRRPHRAAG